MQQTLTVIYYTGKGGIMDRFKAAAEFIVVGLFPITLCGVIYLAEILGN